MRAQNPEVTELAAAAQAGDRQARDALLAASLPLVYNVVGRCLDGHGDVDDIVQETMLRVVDRLDGLRDPASYRSWLVAIAMNQVRDRAAAAHARGSAPDLDAVRELPDPKADFVDLTILRLGLSGQRREVAEATRWLDEDDRGLLALWWLEAGGELTRAELADAVGLDARHAAVRVQRMKTQLESARGVVRALAAQPRCPGLDDVVRDWDGRPSGLWRKRILRHTRACDACGARGRGMVPAERLLAGLPLVVPFRAEGAPGPIGGTDPAGAGNADPGLGGDPQFHLDGAPDSGSGGAPDADFGGSLDATSAPGPGTASDLGSASGPALPTPPPARSFALAGTAAVVTLAVLLTLFLWPDSEVPEAAAPPPMPTTSAAPVVAQPAPTEPPPPPTTAPESPTPPALTTPPPSLEQQVLDLVNAERARTGCAPLRLDAKLHTAAQRHADAMAARRFMDHTDPDGKGPAERITAAGYRWSAWGENLGQGPVTAASAVRDWMSSTYHRQNMLDCGFRHMGIGTAPTRGGNGLLWTQVLATPA
ncbi:sigma-70 family RNA polymerase sigma factor [Yinghuangia soli]|uniref:Sigma-70 family RNA polymerase sigma factor n=1 Tax=Yinghuangia soli TaxID=2908204 RepID=A0AA41PYT6_9ACTN|nr:sigma-70 family RNA polymerase sigma factor [Yinghuangia soli]MCF2528370.1 sigma-70 family RNA polymerase sigma factor [Yinghuangia soli]